MVQSTTLLAAFLAAVVAVVAQESTEDDDRLFLNPTATRTGAVSCVTRKNETGLCVEPGLCTEEHVIATGGVIDDSELRSYGCSNIKLWCCTKENVKANETASPAATDRAIPSVTPTPSVRPTPSVTPTPWVTPDPAVNSGCAVTSQIVCPWCVKLYRNGTDHRKLPSGLFCMGTLIGSNVVLTAATCLLQAEKKALWVRIPNALDPNKDYHVIYRQKHDQYNTGTREYDIALLKLQEDVIWNSDGPKGACIGTRSSLQGECHGAGIDDNENVSMSPLFVSKGGCNLGGDVTDAACGQAVADCSVVTGAPVMCRADGGAYLTVGIVKVRCLPDPDGGKGSLLGNFNLAGNWLENQLQSTLQLKASDFLRSAA